MYKLYDTYNGYLGEFNLINLEDLEKLKIEITNIYMLDLHLKRPKGMATVKVDYKRVYITPLSIRCGGTELGDNFKKLTYPKWYQTLFKTKTYKQYKLNCYNNEIFYNNYMYSDIDTFKVRVI